MKVLHINTFTRGGAAAAAVKIHKGLREKGVNSKILSQIGEITPADIETYRCDLKSRDVKQIWKFVSAKIKFRLLTFLRHSKGNNFEIFTYPYSAYDILDHPLVKEADIIHLHWVAGLVDYPTFFKGVGKPVVWTLHDMNPFLGGFHYREDGDLHRSKLLGKVDMKLKNHKQDIFQDSRNISLVGPSVWMTNEAKNSGVFKEAQHIQIPYGVDTDTFKPENKQAARNALELPQGKIILTFISDNVHVRRKGFALLKDAIEQLRSSGKGDNILIVKIGSGSVNIEGIRDMGRINDLKTMALILSASDALILPSLEDNFPNVMLEANSCGCPVIGFPVGGIKEFIQDMFNGLLAKEASASALAEALNSFVRQKELWDSDKIREHIIKNYSIGIQADRYLDLYNRRLEEAR